MNTKALVLAATIIFAATPLYAHCGMCGVGEAAPEAGSQDAHTMENTTCLCGMKVTEKSIHLEHEGKTYHFCSLACANHFKSNPEASAEKLTK